MSHWRDSNPNQRGDIDRGPDDAHSSRRRRRGPQAVNVRRGEAHSSLENEEPRSPSRRSAARKSPGITLPIEPRALAIVIAGALILIVLSVLLTRAVSGPTAEPTPSTVAAVVSPTPSEPTPVPTQGSVQATIVPLEPSYTVQSGDTLAIIARRFNTTVDALVSINNLTDRNSLRVGQRLIIPNQ